MSMVAKHSSANQGGQLSTPVRRLLWKDARELVPIWLAVALATGLTLALTFWSTNVTHASLSPLYLAAHTLIGFFALVTEICLFASENENRTVHLLRNLPLKPTVVVGQKLAVGVAGVLVFSLVAASVASLLASCSASRSTHLNESHFFSATNCIAFPLLYFAISSLAATLTRSFFYGFLWAGAVLLAIMVCVEPTWFGYVRDSYPDGWLKGSLMSLAAVAAGAFVIGRSRVWIEERVPHSPRIIAAGSSLNSKPSTARKQLSRLSVLLWQSFAQSKRVLVIYFGLVAAATVCCWWNFELEGSTPSGTWLLRSLSFLCGAMFLLIPFSASIFLADHRSRNFRFFQQNVESPRLFWFARLLPWWCLIAAIVLLWQMALTEIELPVQDLVYGYRYNNWRSVITDTLFEMNQFARQSMLVPSLVLLGIVGIGQFFSMIVRSSILATIFAVLINLCFVFFACYVVFVDESVWLFLALPVVSVYLATWFGVHDWLGGKTGWRCYGRPLAIATTAAVLAIGGFVYHRATEFDDVVFNADNLSQYLPKASGMIGLNYGLNDSGLYSNYGTPAERKRAAKLYREAISLSVKPANYDDPYTAPRLGKAARQAFLDRNVQSIEKIIEAAQCGGCDPFLSEEDDELSHEISILTHLMHVYCDQQIGSGSLEDAFESILAFDRLQNRLVWGASNRNNIYGYLVRWAERPDQTLKLIKRGIEHLEANYKIDPTDGSRISRVALNERWKTETFELGGEGVISSLQYALRDLHNEQAEQYDGIRKTFRLFPWEWVRFQKLAQRAELAPPTILQTVAV